MNTALKYTVTKIYRTHICLPCTRRRWHSAWATSRNLAPCGRSAAQHRHAQMSRWRTHQQRSLRATGAPWLCSGCSRKESTLCVPSDKKDAGRTKRPHLLRNRGSVSGGARRGRVRWAGDAPCVDLDHLDVEDRGERGAVRPRSSGRTAEAERPAAGATGSHPGLRTARRG